MDNENIGNRSPETMSNIPSSIEGGENGNLNTAETMGNVAEVMGETRDVKGSGGTQGTTNGNRQTGQKVNINEIKADLLKTIPSEKVMKRQIAKEINREIDYLQRRAKRMLRSSSSSNYFEMANIVKKMRELRHILANLVRASLDNLKTLWLRFVHGLM